MRSLLFPLLCAGLMCAPLIGAQAEPAAGAASDQATPAAAKPPDATASKAEDAPAQTEAPKAGETKTAETPAPAISDKKDTSATAPAAAEPEAPTTAPATTPKAPPPVVDTAAEARAAQSAALVTTMEQLLMAQHEREVSLYRETIRLVMIFGITFAVICMVAVLAAALLNYRALIAVQSALTRGTPAETPEPVGSLLPLSPAPATVPGMERVRASGQRFQTRMSSLEQRLAELEHLTGRGAPDSREGIELAAEEAPSRVDEAGNEPPEVEATAPAPRVVPRAMILVHKAQAQMNLGKLTDALATLDEAASLEFGKPEVHLARGQVLEKLGRLADALQAYESAVQSDEANTNALLMKAGVLNRQERFTEALACYERALEVHRAHA